MVMAMAITAAVQRTHVYECRACIVYDVVESMPSTNTMISACVASSHASMRSREHNAASTPLLAPSPDTSAVEAAASPNNKFRASHSYS